MIGATLFSGIGAPETAMPSWRLGVVGRDREISCRRTNITYRGKPAADGPRYKSLGNSMAVPVMRWILQRIEFVDALAQARAA